MINVAGSAQCREVWVCKIQPVEPEIAVKTWRLGFDGFPSAR